MICQISNTFGHFGMRYLDSDDDYDDCDDDDDDDDDIFII